MATWTVTTRARLTWQGELAVDVVKVFVPGQSSATHSKAGHGDFRHFAC